MEYSEPMAPMNNNIVYSHPSRPRLLSLYFLQKHFQNRPGMYKDAVYGIHVQLGCMVLFLICLRIAILEMKFLNFHRLNEAIAQETWKWIRKKRTHAERKSFSIIDSTVQRTKDKHTHTYRDIKTCPMDEYSQHIYIFSQIFALINRTNRNKNMNKWKTLRRYFQRTSWKMWIEDESKNGEKK